MNMALYKCCILLLFYFISGIDYIQVCAVPPLVSVSKTVAQTVTAANRRTQTFLPTNCYNLYKNINLCNISA